MTAWGRILKDVQLLCFIFALLGVKAGHTFEVNSIQYKPLSHSQSAVQSLSLNEITSKFQKYGFMAVPTSGSGPISLSWLDRVFFSHNVKSAVFLKYGLEPLSKDSIGTLIQDDKDSYLFHGTTPNQIPFAVYFVDVDAKEAIQLVNLISSTAVQAARPKTSARLMIDALVPSAYAEESSSCQTGLQRSTLGLPSGDPVGVVTDKVFQVGLGCAKGLLGGFWDSTGGLVLSVFNGKAWGAMKDTWNGIKLLFTGFSKTISEDYRGFQKLPFDVQAKIFCDLLGVVAGTAFTTIMTDGILALNGGFGVTELAWGRITLKIRAALAAMELNSKYKNQLRAAKTPHNQNCANASSGVNGAANKARAEQVQTELEHGNPENTLANPAQ
jgi:hypothetical protein